MHLDKRNRHSKSEQPVTDNFKPLSALLAPYAGNAEVKKILTDKKERCRFDLFVRYRKTERREKEEFCYRGDFYGITEPHKMLCSLLRLVIKQHPRFFIVELYDNTKPKNDLGRVVLKMQNGAVMENRLNQYGLMLSEFPLPDWLKDFRG